MMRRAAFAAVFFFALLHLGKSANHTTQAPPVVVKSTTAPVVIPAGVPVVGSMVNGTVCYGEVSYLKTACITSKQSVPLLGQNGITPTAVLMEVMPSLGASMLPAIPLLSAYDHTKLDFTSIIANKQTTTGRYTAEWMIIQDNIGGRSSIQTNLLQFGQVTINAFETRQKCKAHNFLTTMAGVPSVKLTPQSRVSEELVYFWLTDVTTAGFKICYHEGVLFSGSHAFQVFFVAIANQGQIYGQRDSQLEHGRTGLTAGSKAATGVAAFCQVVTFSLTYITRPFVFVTAEAAPAAKGEFISWVSSISNTQAVICARNSEDNPNGVRTAAVTLNYVVIGARIDLEPGMVQLVTIPKAPTVFCKDVTFVKNFWAGLPMHVQLTVTWQKTTILANNGNHEAAAVWAEGLTHAGFKACALVAGRHFADNYPIPAVNWLAYQLPSKACVKPQLVGGNCALNQWYTGARCCSVTVPNVINSASEILVSVRHTRLQTYIDAMTAWAELSTCKGATTVRLCARELQNFDGLHSGIILEWLLSERDINPFIPEHGMVIFQRQFFGVGSTMPAVCQNVNWRGNYGNLPIASVIVSPKNTTACRSCNHGFSSNDLVTWIETRTQTNMRICMKSIRACLHREEAHLSYIVVTEPRCGGRVNGYFLKDTFCHDWRLCNDGAYSEGTCGQTSYFNLQSGQCQNNVPATGCQDPRCIGKANGFYLINNFCKNYYQCTDGFYKEYTCANNGYFSLANRQCQAGVPTGCQDPRCANKQDGFYLINNFCESYYQCNSGFYTLNNCAANKYYNTASGACETAVPTGCQHPTCKTKSNGFYLIDTLCMNYYKCTNGLYLQSTCGTGRYFSLTSGVCINTVPNGCQDPRCIGFTDGFYLVNNKCQNYYQCSGGFYTAISCLNNQYFNLITRQCQSAVPTGCQDPRCIGQTNGFYLINNLCQQYYQCRDGFYVAGDCKGNTPYFNLQSGVCQTSLPGGCQDPRCTGKTNAFYLINNFCTSYYQCKDGFYSGLGCTQGSYFNMGTGACQSTVPAGCRDPRCTNVANGYYRIDTACKGYYQCQDGFYTGSVCAVGYWNTAINQCQTAVPAGCQDPRCNNQGNGYVLMNNLCQSYYRCQNGFYTSGSCSNQQYFNVQTGSCQSTLPSGCQDPRCTGKADGNYFLNNVCTAYINCAAGFYTIKSCTAGSYFNTASGQCQSNLPTGCQDPRCTIRGDGQYVLDTLCKSYFTCTNGFYALLTCANNGYFSTVSRGCQTAFPTGQNCQDPRCKDIKNGNYRLTSDSQCKSYYTCSNGQYTSSVCGNNGYFHSNTQSCSAAASTDAGCQDPRCLGLIDGFYLLNNLCTSYYECQSGQYSLKSCSNGQYFNKVSKSCQSVVPSGCLDPRCTGRTGSFTTNSLCTSYFTCTAAGAYNGFTCPGKEYFNVVSGSCQPAVPSGCQDPLCIGKENQKYRTNLLCTSWYQCQSGLAIQKEINCPTNQYFNEATQNCQSTTPTGCQHSYCQTRSDGNYAVDTVCKNYYKCAAGFRTLSSCGNGFFSPATSQCQNAVPNGCQHPDCAGGKTGSFLVDNKCQSFYMCNNGLKSVAACPTGFYFNTQFGSCTTTLPTGCANPICSNKGNGAWVLNTVCTSYYTCQNGVHAQLSCSTGYFNQATGACQAAVPSGCQNPLCGGRANGFYKSNNLCQSYYQCNGGVYTPYNCNSGLYFNEATATSSGVQTCQSAVPSGCIDPICSGRTDGYYISDGNVCKSYYVCANGFRTTGICANGFMNVATKQCQNNLPTSCSTTVNTQCSSVADGTYRGTDPNCRSYYTCSNNGATFSFQNCATLTPYFNSATKSCQAALPAGCTAISTVVNHCAGKADAWHVLDAYCLTYFQCINQQVPTLLNCPTGEYSDHTKPNGQCSPTVPSNCYHPTCLQKLNNVQTTLTGWYASDNTCTAGFRCSLGKRVAGDELRCNSFSIRYYNGGVLQNNAVNTNFGTCTTTRPAACQQQNLCAGKTNGNYIGDDNICRVYYQCNNQQAPSFQYCFDSTKPYFNTASGQCQDTVPTNCRNPLCYSITSTGTTSAQANNGIQITYKSNGFHTLGGGVCAGGYTCNNGVYSGGVTCQGQANQYYINGSCQFNNPGNCPA